VTSGQYLEIFERRGDKKRWKRRKRRRKSAYIQEPQQQTPFAG